VLWKVRRRAMTGYLRECLLAGFARRLAHGVSDGRQIELGSST
jgi:hypothetical protein